MSGVKTVEKIVAAYVGLSGILFLLVPSTLSPTIYTAWGSLPQEQWGWMMLTVAIAHMLSLLSPEGLTQHTLRAVACGAHATLSLCFAWMFMQSGVYWGCILFAFLMPALLYQVGKEAVRRLFLAGCERAPPRPRPISPPPLPLEENRSAHQSERGLAPLRYSGVARGRSPRKVGGIA